jgi:uncharacterized protein (DUF111 family)
MNQAPTEVVELAANLDDATGEIVGAAVEALLREGALDVWTTAIQMKKNRPGVTISVLCEPTLRERISRRLIELTGTFGLRYRTWNRTVLDRQHRAVHTEFGAVRVKVGSLNGDVLVTKPEFDDVQAAAQKHGVSVLRVIDAARVAAASQGSEEGHR